MDKIKSFENMERLKFKAFNRFLNKIYDVLNISYLNGVIKRIEVKDDDRILIFDEWQNNIDNTFLMQCTGLKDKNGKLIYEGYILKYTSKPTNTQKNNPEYKPYTENYFVVWEDFYTGYNLRSKEKVNCFNLGIMAKDCEVIGNIYENPELMEVENAG